MSRTVQRRSVRVIDSPAEEETPLIGESSPASLPRRVRNHFLAFYKAHLSVELDNSKGSVARDHLANERTYLAWLRTSLSVASAGVGVTQLLRLNTVDDNNRNNERVGRLRRLGKPAGATLIGLALLVIIFGNLRYFTAQAAMQRGKFPASRLFIAILSFTTALVLISGLLILLVLNPAAPI